MDALLLHRLASSNLWLFGRGSVVTAPLAQPPRPWAARTAALRRPRLSRSTRSFLEAYRPGWVWVVNESLARRGEVGGVEVTWLPLSALPAALAAACSSVSR